MGEPDGLGLINLARLNLSSGDLEACLSCSERALALGLDPASHARLRGVVDELAGELPAASRQRFDSLRERLATQAPTPAEAPPAARGAEPGEATEIALEAARAFITPQLVRLLRAVKPEGSDRASVPLVEAVGRLLAADLDLWATLGLVLDLTRVATGAERGFVLARNQEGELALRAQVGLGSEALTPDLSATILGEVERTRQPVICEDAQRDERFKGRESIVRRKVRSIACLPILGESEEDDLEGVIYLEDPRGAGRFDGELTDALRDLARLVAGPIRRARRFASEQQAHARARAELLRTRRLVGESAALQRALSDLARVASSTLPVRLEGESGTGKELAARFLHQLSARAERPLVTENCAALPETLLEAELFGVARGAFTGADADRPGVFQRAEGGTLLLDEVSELSPACQAKLLRVLQEGEVRPVGAAKPIPVDVRVVVASNLDLASLVREGRFREDLFYRLDGARVLLPPLRQRREDIPLLVEHFLQEIRAERREAALQLSEATLAALSEHDWPGNVRELRNAVWRLAIAGDDGAPWLAESSAPVVENTGLELRIDLGAAGQLLSLKEARAFVEREYLAAVLAHHGGNVTHAAEALGVQRTHLSRLITRLGLRS